MSTTDIIAAVVPAKAKVLKPARKQVKPGEVEKKETPQTGKEYSELIAHWFRPSAQFFLRRHLV